MRGLALVGFMGAGKSTVGRALSARLGRPFLDTDDVLTARFGPPAVQIGQEGEAAFRAREAALVDELVARAGGEVLATGGGLVVDPLVRARLRTAYDLVALDAPLEVLAERVGAGDDRPLWDADVAARFATRRSAYGDADLVLPTAERDVDAVVEAIVAWWTPGDDDAAPG